MDIGEFELISLIKKGFKAPEGVTGIGDDCAIIPQRSGMETLISTDMLMEGVHFLFEDIEPYDLGWKSAAVNISDIAGMGGCPTATFLSFALPSKTGRKWVEQFIDGYRELSSRYDCPLLGGDTTSSLDRICINVTVLGQCPSGKAMKRNGAKPGDLICVSGPLGDSGAGLKLILEGKAPRTGLEDRLVARHYRPVPRVKEGLNIATTPGSHAMMDISDGIGSDIRHILKASEVCAEIDVKMLPLSDDLLEICAIKNWDSVGLALDGGEDYELLFTVTPDALPELQKKNPGLSPVGRIVPCTQGEEPGQVKWLGTDKEHTGFRHF